MFSEKCYQRFICLTDANEDCHVWVDTSKIVMMKPWTKKDKYGREVVVTYIACDTSFAVEVKESIKLILKMLGEDE